LTGGPGFESFDHDGTKPQLAARAIQMLPDGHLLVGIRVVPAFETGFFSFGMEVQLSLGPLALPEGAHDKHQDPDDTDDSDGRR
jgi:hypothetical protein